MTEKKRQTPALLWQFFNACWSEFVLFPSLRKANKSIQAEIEKLEEKKKAKRKLFLEVAKKLPDDDLEALSNELGKWQDTEVKRLDDLESKAKIFVATSGSTTVISLIAVLYRDSVNLDPAIKFILALFLVLSSLCWLLSHVSAFLAIEVGKTNQISSQDFEDLVFQTSGTPQGDLTTKLLFEKYWNTLLNQRRINQKSNFLSVSHVYFKRGLVCLFVGLLTVSSIVFCSSLQTAGVEIFAFFHKNSLLLFLGIIVSIIFSSMLLCEWTMYSVLWIVQKYDSVKARVALMDERDKKYPSG